MPNKVTVSDATLRQAAEERMDAFVDTFVDAINASVGGKLTAETMAQLNASQITLLAYRILRDEVMDGGFIQLIHNGYGGFIFLNPFAKMVKQWGIIELGRLISKVHPNFKKYREEIEKDCTDESLCHFSSASQCLTTSTIVSLNTKKNGLQPSPNTWTGI